MQKVVLALAVAVASAYVPAAPLSTASRSASATVVQMGIEGMAGGGGKMYPETGGKVRTTAGQTTRVKAGH